MKTIDSAVARVLRVKFQLGLFEHPYADENEVTRWNGNPVHKALAKQAALESIVLLKIPRTRRKKNILPLSKNISSLAVIGSDAVEARFGRLQRAGKREDEYS